MLTLTPDLLGVQETSQDLVKNNLPLPEDFQSWFCAQNSFNITKSYLQSCILTDLPTLKTNTECKAELLQTFRKL